MALRGRTEGQGRAGETARGCVFHPDRSGGSRTGGPRVFRRPGKGRRGGRRGKAKGRARYRITTHNNGGKISGVCFAVGYITDYHATVQRCSARARARARVAAARCSLFVTCLLSVPGDRSRVILHATDWRTNRRDCPSLNSSFCREFHYGCKSITLADRRDTNPADNPAASHKRRVSFILWRIVTRAAASIASQTSER